MILLLEADEVRALLHVIQAQHDPDNPNPFFDVDHPTCVKASQLLHAIAFPEQNIPGEVEALLADDYVMTIVRYVVDQVQQQFNSHQVRGKLAGITVFDNTGTLAIHLNWE